MTMASVYRVLATEAETAVEQFALNKEQLETTECRLLDGCRIVAEQRAKVGRLNIRDTSPPKPKRHSGSLKSASRSLRTNSSYSSFGRALQAQ